MCKIHSSLQLTVPNVQYPNYTQRVNENIAVQYHAQPNVLSVMYATQNNSLVSSYPAWYPDSRASYRVTSDPANLAATTEAKTQQQLLVGNGDALREFQALVWAISLLVKVLTETSFKNLLNASQLTKDNSICLEFHPEYCCVKDKATGAMFFKGRLKNGLYFNLLNFDVT